VVVVFRAVRRFGAAGSAVSARPASPVDEVAALRVAGVRAVRGLAAARVFARAVDEVVASTTAPASPESAVAVRVVRRFGAAWVASTGTPVAASTGDAAARPVRVLGFRPARAFGSVAASGEADVVPTVGSEPVGAAGLRSARPAGARPAGADTFWATCARSNASSSGGTSLHGSLEPRLALGSRSGRLYPRSSRAGPAGRVRAETSG
jgi:hypothetical protein